jgi:hypothetical protein
LAFVVRLRPPWLGELVRPTAMFADPVEDDGS